MAEYELIGAYLVEMRHSLRRLAVVDDVIDEVADHLLEVTAQYERSGLNAFEAQSRALARFGSAPLVARTFIVEARKGSAMPTTFTRRAGLAAMLIPLTLAVGWRLNSWTNDFLHGVGGVLLFVAFVEFVVATAGLRARHRGIDRQWSRAAFVIACASPALAIPFGWGAPFALVGWLGAAAAVAGVGMVRAAILPRWGTLLLTFTAPVVGVVAGIGTYLERDMGGAISYGLPPLLLGLVVTGFALWREHAFDEPPVAAT
jgi:hypothetical protein